MRAIAKYLAFALGGAVALGITATAALFDNEPPILIGPESLEYQLDGGECLQEVVYDLFVKDNLDPEPSVRCSHPSGYWYMQGQYEVVCTAEDAAGNQSSIRFPMVIWGEINGIAFIDRNRNTVYDSNERPLTNTAVRLYNASSGALIAETTTNGNGRFRFTQLPHGRYRIHIDAGTRYLPTTRNPQDTALPRDCGKLRQFGFSERTDAVKSQ